MSGIVVLFIMSLSTGMALLVNDTKDSHVLDIQKRWLNWNSNKVIVSDVSSLNNMRIDRLFPHENNDQITVDKDYMAFTLYRRNGQSIRENAGVFHFIETGKVSSNACGTLHAKAYMHFYGNCPKDDKDIVASGYCYRGTQGKSLVFHTYTFNSAGMSYLDGQYYVGTSNEMNTFEQNLISSCFNDWKDADFPVTSWKCETQYIPLAKRSTREMEHVRFRRSETCSDCDCLVTSEAWCFLPLTLSNYLLATLMLHASSIFSNKSSPMRKK